MNEIIVLWTAVGDEMLRQPDVLTVCSKAVIQKLACNSCFLKCGRQQGRNLTDGNRLHANIKNGD